MRRRIGSMRICVIGLLAWALLGAGSAPAQTPPPESLAAARELVVATRMDDLMKNLMPVMVQQLKPAIVQGRAHIERDFDALMPQFMATMSARMQEFVDLVAVIYARNFTAAELREITAFYRTPVGQKFVRNQTSLAQQAAAAGQTFAQGLLRDMQQRIIQELRNQGHDL